jgi:hypothetical protein
MKAEGSFYSITNPNEDYLIFYSATAETIYYLCGESNRKAKEATIYDVNLFPKEKSIFRCLKQFIWQFKTENNRIGQQVPTARLV